MTTSTTRNVKLADLTIDDVRSVYSGKAGKCCCGCAGKHSYNPAHVKEATKDRGYSIDENEINARQVKRVLNIIKANAAANGVTVEKNAPYVDGVVHIIEGFGVLEPGSVFRSSNGNLASVDIAGREYIVYSINAVQIVS